MIDIKTFRENATKENLCSEYVQKWDACGSHKQYVDLALSSKGVDYLCDSIAKGWGVSPQYVIEKFDNFINGKYVSQQEGYTSELFCLYNGDITARTTVITAIESNITITVPEYHICNIYISGKSTVNVRGKGQCVLICYGSQIETTYDETIKHKRINKKERDKYE